MGSSLVVVSRNTNISIFWRWSNRSKMILGWSSLMIRPE